MTKASLNPAQRRTVELIQALGFGVIERLSIRGGVPCYDPEPHVVQSIKLRSECERPPHDTNAALSLKQEFTNLFRLLSQLPDGVVDIEVQHSVPFRLSLERRCKELALSPADKP